MKIKQIHKGQLYSAIFSEEHIKKWDPLIKGALLKEIKGMSEYDRLLCIWNNPKYLLKFRKWIKCKRKKAKVFDNSLIITIL